MQNIKEFTEDLLDVYEKVKSGEMSIRQGTALANIANTVLRAVVIQSTMLVEGEEVKSLNEINERADN